MAIIFAQNVSELAINATYAGRPVVNVLHFVNDEGSLSDEAKARDILNNWQDHIMERLVSAYVLNDATWRSLDPDDTNQGVLVPDQTKRLAGQWANPGAPPNVAWLVKKITNNRQRGQRDGRMFIAGVDEAAIDNAGVINAANLTEWNTALDAFLGGVNDEGFATNIGSGLVVLNTTPESRNPGTTPVTLTYRTVGDLAIDQKVASQRDRLR